MKRVLVVDDKEENLYYLTALLTGHGCTVETARHGAEALVKARAQPPDLVVSDLLMPVMDGFTLLRHWKADARLRSAPFVVYTATYTEAEDERLALNLGADAFILKPAEPEDFLARIRKIETARATASPAPPQVPSGDDAANLRLYSETLIRKLEEKTLLLEETNRSLQQDIAERKRAEERVAEQAALLDQAGDAIFVCDPGHLVRYWNRGAERLYGWSAAEAVGRRLETLVGLGGTEAAALEAAIGRGDWSGELRHRDKNGAEVTVASRWSLMRDDSGRPKSILAINTDITERKRIEAQFLRAQRLEIVGSLAGGVAHDLNNMLAPVVMGVTLLKQAPLAPDLRPIVDTMERSVQRGTALVQQVLSFARGAETARGPLRLADVVSEFTALAATTFPKHIAVDTDLPADLWLVPGNATEIYQVILNLGVNARDAMPRGGTFRIGARNLVVDRQHAVMNGSVPPGRYVVLTFADTGTGMDTATVGKIFEPFFTTKGAGRGTGLGLSTTRAIVRGHGGHIDVRSVPGSGTAFDIYLPADPTVPGASRSPFPAAEMPRGHGELVLVVDDESSILHITRQTLEAFGYRVLIAEDGAQAIGLYALNRAEVAVVLTDIVMPVMDGVGLAAALRRLSPDVRIVAASGFSSPANPARLAEVGIRHFLAKPYTAEALLETLRRALAEGPPVSPPPP